MHSLQGLTVNVAAPADATPESNLPVVIVGSIHQRRYRYYEPLTSGSSEEVSSLEVLARQ